MPRARTVTAGVAALIAVAAAAAAGGYAVTAAARGPAVPATPTPSAPAAVRAAGSSPPGVPAGSSATGSASGAARSILTPARVAAALRPALGVAALGGDVRADVVSLTTGRTLYASRAGEPSAPASIAKLLTAAAALSVYAGTHRFTTAVRVASSGDVVLVGGGDPTLTAAAAGRAGAYPGAARLGDLASAVRRAGVPVRRIVVAGGLFAGPSVSPSWAPEDVPSDYGSAITALMVDGGRASPSATVRSATPDLDAGHAFAAALGRGSLPVVRGSVPAGSRVLARVRSASLATLIAQMLQRSDNVIAECLGRQVALASGQPASFGGAAAAIRAVVRRTGIDAGTGMLDASGLAPRDRLAPATLVAVLRAATATPGLRDLVTGLAVAGWSGTLVDRFLSGAARDAAGVTRAKTGTLTGVSTLAGLVHTRSGELTAFVIAAEGVADTEDAESALDAAIGRLADCGC